MSTIQQFVTNPIALELFLFGMIDRARHLLSALITETLLLHYNGTALTWTNVAQIKAGMEPTTEHFPALLAAE